MHEVGVNAVRTGRIWSKTQTNVDEVQGNLLRDLPGWFEELADNLVDGEASTVGKAQASSSHVPPRPKPPPEVVSGKHSIFYVLPDGPKLRSTQKDHNYEGVLAENAPGTKYLEQKNSVT